MKKMIFTIIVLFLLHSPLFSAAKLLNGVLKGKVQGSISISDNLTIQLFGKLSGTWEAKLNDDGSISGNASGSFGAIDANGTYGFSGTFNVRYDPKTQKLVGTWTVPGLGEENSIEFSVDEFTGKFKGPISGKVPTSSGGADFKGFIYLDFSGFQTELTGSVDASLRVKVHWKLLNTDSACTEGYVADPNGIVKGKWHVNIASDQSLTGEASGVFSGIALLNLDVSNPCISRELSTLASLAGTMGMSISIPPVSLKFPYYGTWMGTLQGDIANGFYFGGSWTESYDEQFYQSMGAGFEDIDISEYEPENPTGKFGGSVRIDIDVSNATETVIPINGLVEGGGTANVNLKKLAQQQGICTEYSALIQKIPSTFLPGCLASGNICDCLPDYVTVQWKLKSIDLEGSLGLGD